MHAIIGLNAQGHAFLFVVEAPKMSDGSCEPGCISVGPVDLGHFGRSNRTFRLLLIVNNGSV